MNMGDCVSAISHSFDCLSAGGQRKLNLNTLPTKGLTFNYLLMKEEGTSRQEGFPSSEQLGSPVMNKGKKNEFQQIPERFNDKKRLSCTEFTE